MDQRFEPEHRGAATEQIAPSTPPAPRSAFWPERFIGPAPGLKELNVLCWGAFLVLFLAPVAIVLWARVRSGLRFSSILPVDFIYFYGDGRIANTYPPARLYDLTLQLHTFNQIFPLQENHYGPSPYPPFVAQFFRFYAKAGFIEAYFLWMATSLALYLGGLLALVQAAFGREKLKGSLVICFALIYPAFVSFTLAVGQISTIGFFALCFAFYLEKRSKLFASGIALSILCYKPTLIFLLLPMLLLTRRVRTLAGFATGAVALFAATTALDGIAIWPVFLRFLRAFTRMTGENGQFQFSPWLYVDLNAFSHLVPGGRSAPARILLALIVAAVVLGLAWLLWKATAGSRPAQDLAWATVVTWTLLLNLYVPLYDTVLVVFSLAVTLGALNALRWTRAAASTILTGLVLYGCSANAKQFEIAHGVQLMTIGLFLFGSLQIFLLQRALRHSQIQPIAGDVSAPAPALAS